MDLLEIVDIAEHLRLPVTTVRYYRDRFILYVPSVRLGRCLRYPVEAIAVIDLIDRHTRSGAPSDEIEALLQARFPVTVIAAQELDAGPQPTDTSARVDELRSAIGAHHADLQTEIAALRQQMAALVAAQRERGLQSETAAQHAERARAAALRDELTAVHGAIAELRAELREDRARWKAFAGLLVAGTPEAVDPAAESAPPAAGDDDQLQTDPLDRRVPRRMGQPLRANGTVPG